MTVFTLAKWLSVIPIPVNLNCFLVRSFITSLNRMLVNERLNIYNILLLLN